MKVGHVAISSAHNPKLLLSHFYNGNKITKTAFFITSFRCIFGLPGHWASIQGNSENVPTKLKNTPTFTTVSGVNKNNEYVHVAT